MANHWSIHHRTIQVERGNAYNNKWVVIKGKPLEYAAVHIALFNGLQRLIHHQHCIWPDHSWLYIWKRMSKFLFHRHHMQWHTSSKPIVSQLDQHSSKHSLSNNCMCWGWYSSFVSCMGLDAPGDHVWLSITYSLHKELPLDIEQQMLCNCKRPIWIQHFHNAHDFWKKEGFNDLEREIRTKLKPNRRPQCITTKIDFLVSHKGFLGTKRRKGHEAYRSQINQRGHIPIRVST